MDRQRKLTLPKIQLTMETLIQKISDSSGLMWFAHELLGEARFVCTDLFFPNSWPPGGSLPSFPTDFLVESAHLPKLAFTTKLTNTCFKKESTRWLESPKNQHRFLLPWPWPTGTSPFLGAGVIFPATQSSEIHQVMPKSKSRSEWWEMADFFSDETN